MQELPFPQPPAVHVWPGAQHCDSWEIGSRTQISFGVSHGEGPHVETAQMPLFFPEVMH